MLLSRISISLFFLVAIGFVVAAVRPPYRHSSPRRARLFGRTLAVNGTAYIAIAVLQLAHGRHGAFDVLQLLTGITLVAAACLYVRAARQLERSRMP
jgi:uncharacterized membrane protein HdeD (DUF308 family)